MSFEEGGYTRVLRAAETRPRPASARSPYRPSRGLSWGLDIIGSDTASSLRIPIGDDAYGCLDEAEQAYLAEFAAARIIAQGTPPT
ncbi:hypothetical protein [Streptomyces sp. NBC_00162]|uniref:hypothetical protein n=1 Tax=Streptomyces sp. NBC_00162 TaxID=2903629 RepID=UPI00214C95C2|nr:hypothetical protein [Streptomyces sp. NBC_00162]UUU38063.1 hypothetical protein JIW86_03835 [Streptomyces sp. NBC_00162]